MLAVATSSATLPHNHVAEPKWDGARACIGRPAGAGAFVRSRHATDLTEAFPELAEAASALLAVLGDVLLDGEIVLWNSEGRLDFGQLMTRLNRRRATALRMAAAWPVHFVAFDLLCLGGPLTGQPYRIRRAALEGFFADQQLTAPWELCPVTTDPAVVRQWLSDWTAVGIEGVIFKDLDRRYQPGRHRSWLKYKPKTSAEAVVGAVSGSLERPGSLLLGRFDRSGRLRFVGRTSTLPSAAAAALGPRLTPGADEHPWRGLRFKAAWGSAGELRTTLVAPSVVVEVDADVARDRAGRFRHPVLFRRVRAELRAADVALFGEPDDRDDGEAAE
jgi:ATP-dependent DNA ligase